MRLSSYSRPPDSGAVELLEREYRGESPLKTFHVLYKGDMGNLIIACIVFIIKHSGVWAMPIVTARIIDVLTKPDENAARTVALYLGLLLIIFAQNLPMHYVFTMYLSKAVRNMEIKLRSAMARSLQHLSMNYYHRQSTGALQTKLMRDVEVIQDLTMQLSQALPAAVFTLVVAITVTFLRTPGFLIFFALTVPVTAFLVRTMQSRLKHRNRAFREQVEGMSSSLFEMLQLLPITRAHGVEDAELYRVQKRLRGVRKEGIRLDLINAFFGAVSWVMFRLFELLCLGTASFVVLTQVIPMSVGDVVMLTGFFTNLTNSVLQIANLVPQITRGFESIRSMGEVLQSPDVELNEGRAVVSEVIGHFRFENVSFKYPDTDDSSIDNLSLTVKPGETVAIVGPSGAGKSTLLNLVIGFIRPTQGQILLDGRDMNALDLRTYRRFLSVVPQETVLFDGTLRENVTYGLDGVSDAVVEDALRAANIYDFVMELPQGVDTPLGEDGSTLSGGQKQRIAIARALIRDPRVLILDEATSALDNITELKIQEALARLMKGRTTFIVAHRLSTIQNADRIIVMEHGRIVEVGSHNDLIQSEGHYAALHRVAVR